MARMLTINLTAPDMVTLEGPRRYLRITELLLEAGFVFEPVDDLPPAAMELVRPWSLSHTDDGAAVIYRQDWLSANITDGVDSKC